MGDGLLVVFGLDDDEEPELVAVRCGITMQNVLDVFSVELRKEAGQPMEMGVGLHVGEMIVGNLGSRSRFDYTVIGDAVNLAARLEGANKVFGTYTMVSEDTRNACGEDIAFRKLGRLRVKGKSVPVTVYEILGRGPPPDWVSTFEGALADFQLGQWKEAEKRFRAVLEMRADDPPTLYYLGRIEQRPVGSTPEDLGGVLTLQTK